jgi:hypothetical protein
MNLWSNVAMRFRVTVEQFKHPEGCGAIECELDGPYWDQIWQKELSIDIAEKAARQIEKLIRDEGLDINSSELRQILFAELHEKNE